MLRLVHGMPTWCRYTEYGLTGLDCLKNADRARGLLLRQVAKQTGLKVCTGSWLVAELL